MEKCWANSIGGCSNVLSAEHPISKAIFADDTGVTAIGMKQFGGPKENLPISALAANVLCTNHNSQLSPLDDFAAKLQRSIALAKTAAMPNLKYVNGLKLERWCVKSLCGVLAAGWTPLGKLKPTSQLVEVAFGKREFAPPLGFHIAVGVKPSSQRIESVNSAMAAPIGAQNGSILGAVFSLSGWPFVLRCATEDGLLEVLQNKGVVSEFDFSNVTLLRHPRLSRIHTADDDKLRMAMLFTW